MSFHIFVHHILTNLRAFSHARIAFAANRTLGGGGRHSPPRSFAPGATQQSFNLKSSIFFFWGGGINNENQWKPGRQTNGNQEGKPTAHPTEN